MVMARTVHHERPDYAYAPRGLMAEDWGKTGHRTEVPGFVRAGQLRMRRLIDDDSGRDAFEYIHSLDDGTLLEAAQYGSDAHREACRRLSDGRERAVNGYWVTARCAAEAYDRDIMSAGDMDRIVDE
jgi:hypothetical protein